MKRTNVADLRSNLSELLAYVKKGKSVQIEKRNVPIARIVPIDEPIENHTELGCGKGTGKIRGNILDPIMESDWEMLEKEES